MTTRREKAQAQLLPGEMLFALSDVPLERLTQLAAFFGGSTMLALNDAVALALFYYETRAKGNKFCIMTPDGGISELRPKREVPEMSA